MDEEGIPYAGVLMRTLAFLLAVSAAARADEVTLKGGGKFRGIVEEKGEKVIVHTEYGPITFDRSQVATIDRTKSSPLQEYQELLKAADLSKAEEVEKLLRWAAERRMGVQEREMRERLCRLRWDAVDKSDPAKLEEFSGEAKKMGCAAEAQLAVRAAFGLRRAKVDRKDADALYALGLWAKANGLGADALVLFQEAIAAKPDHEFARRALGYQLHKGQWMTETEVKLAMGLILFEGDWMTPQAKEAILTARTLEKERRLLEEAREKLARERAAAKAEFERQKAELDARAAEAARRAEELERRGAVGGCGFAGCVVVGRHAHGCAVAGCGILTLHRHCPRAGCALTTIHTH